MKEEYKKNSVVLNVKDDELGQTGIAVAVQCYMSSHGSITNPDNRVSAAQFMLV